MRKFFKSQRTKTRRHFRGTGRAPDKKLALTILANRGVPVQTVIDIGIATGTIELMEAYPDRKHVLFEPVLEFKSHIEHNYAHMDFILHSTAVGAENGETELYIYDNTGGGGISHSGLMAPDENMPSHTRVVKKVTLDEAMGWESHPEPFLLKIDVDGDEMQILSGAAEVLKKCSVVIIETPGHHIAERINALHNAGFHIFDLCEPCYYDGAFWQCDVIFVRKDIFNEHFKQLRNENFDPDLYQIFRVT